MKNVVYKYMNENAVDLYDRYLSGDKNAERAFQEAITEISKESGESFSDVMHQFQDEVKDYRRRIAYEAAQHPYQQAQAAKAQKDRSFKVASKLNEIAKSNMRSNSGLNYRAALEKALFDNPTLAKEYNSPLS